MIFRAWDSVLDRWANFDFKPMFSGVVTPATPLMWVSEEDQRRLRAYSLLEAYVKNKSRIWIGKVIGSNVEDTENRREYGDASLLVKTTLSSLLGTDWSIVTRGALGEVEGIDEKRAQLQHEYVLQWADKEKFSLKLIENETQAIKFGDGVYALGWDPRRKRPRLAVYDPAMYFPVLDEKEGGNEDFPHEVFIAWEYEEEDQFGNVSTYVRKQEWVLDVPESVDEPSVCRFRDAVWTLEAAARGWIGVPTEILTSSGPDQAEDDQGWVDTGLDFIPVVHIPNTPSEQEHFGESVLADVLQILDDVQSVDTDLQAAAATTGSPPIAVTGMGGDEEEVYGPGTVLRTGDGTATLLDTSNSLDALLKLKDSLLERLAVNSRTPESLLGRVKPNEVPSGIALTLSFTPHAGMIEQMRLIRDYKYRLLFNFVLRIAQANRAFPQGELQETKMKFGSYLPADKQEAMNLVVGLLTAKAISLETAVQMLIESGYPISDYITEIERIQQRDFEGAQQVLAITGNPELAAERLGISAEEVEVLDEDVTSTDDAEVGL